MPFCTHWTSQTLLSFLLLCIFQKEKNIQFETFWKSSTYLFKSIEIHWKISFCNIASEVSDDYFQPKIWIFAPKKLQQILLERFCWLVYAILPICIQLHIWKISDPKSVCKSCKYYFWCENSNVTFFGDFRRRQLCQFSNTMNRSIEIAMHCSRDNLKNNLKIEEIWFYKDMKKQFQDIFQDKNT